MKLSKIRQIALTAVDVDESLAFYRDTLGASLIAKYDQPGLVIFDFDGTRILLEKGAKPGTVYFWVDDIDAAYRELEAAGVGFDQAPHLIFPDHDGTFGPAGEEEWMAFFRDPAGNVLALASRRQPD